MIKIIFISLFSGLIGSFAFMFTYNRMYERSYGVVRVDKIIANHLAEYAKENKGTADSAKDFAKILEETINQISKKERVILLVAPAVVTNLPDYTEKIEDRVRKGLRDAEK